MTATVTLTPPTAIAYAVLILDGVEQGTRTAFTGTAPPALIPATAGTHIYALFADATGGTAKATSPPITVEPAPILATAGALAGFPTTGYAGTTLDLSGATITLTPSGATGYAVLITGGVEQGARVSFIGTTPPAMTPATAATYGYAVFAAETGGTALATSADIVVTTVPGVLDGLTVPAVAAYSISRQLRSGYTGPLISVKADVAGDETAVDIGAVNGVLDIDAITAVWPLGGDNSSNVVVVKRYEQSADGPPLVSTGSGEYIIRYGVLTDIGGKVAATVSNGATVALSLGTSAASAYTVASSDGTNTHYNYLASYVATGDTSGDGTGKDSVASGVFLASDASASFGFDRNSVRFEGSAPTGNFTAASVFDGTDGTVYVNGAQTAQGASTGAFGATGILWVRNSSGGNKWRGNFGELIIQADANPDDRATIQASQSDYWGTP